MFKQLRKHAERNAARHACIIGRSPFVSANLGRRSIEGWPRHDLPQMPTARPPRRHKSTTNTCVLSPQVAVHIWVSWGLQPYGARLSDDHAKLMYVYGETNQAWTVYRQRLLYQILFVGYTTAHNTLPSVAFRQECDTRQSFLCRVFRPRQTRSVPRVWVRRKRHSTKNALSSDDKMHDKAPSTRYRVGFR